MKTTPAPFAFKMPWKHRGFRQNTLSALESCDSSSFHYEDPGDCLLSIHQRQWVGWAVTATRKPQYRAQAITLHMQRLWSWIVLNREPLQLREPCVPGKSSHFHSAEKQCSKWLGYCSRHQFPGLISSFCWERDNLQSGSSVRAAWFFVVVVSKSSEGIEPICSDTNCSVLHCVGVCVLQGSACCMVRCWTSTVRFVAFSYSHIWQGLSRDGA